MAMLRLGTHHVHLRLANSDAHGLVLRMDAHQRPNYLVITSTLWTLTHQQYSTNPADALALVRLSDTEPREPRAGRYAGVNGHLGGGVFGTESVLMLAWAAKRHRSTGNIPVDEMLTMYGVKHRILG